MSTKPYQYSNLAASPETAPYIRLLRLLPRRNLSDPNELIRCELSPAQLNDANTRYTAISYMWGTRDADRVIELDRASFSVTENLWACLRKFRNLIPGETSLSYIWVDAICINQEDPDERSSQVSQMGAIYAEAQKVVIWPRDPTKKVENATVLRAMNFVRTIIESEKSERNQNTELSFATHFLSFYQDPECDERWSELAALCRTEYWSRVWIVQETVLASSLVLHCEDEDQSITSSLSWEDFVKVCRALADLPTNWPVSKSVLAIRECLPLRLESRRQSSSRSSIQSLLTAFEDSKCSEPRDKIYGLLSLADTDSRITSAITVNYSITMFEVYVDIVWAYGTEQLFNSQICSFSQLIQRTLGGPFPPHNRVIHNLSARRLLSFPAWSKGCIIPIDIVLSASADAAIVSRKRLEALRRCFQSSTYTMGDRDIYLANALNQLEQVRSGYLAAIETSTSYVSDIECPSFPTLHMDTGFKPSQPNKGTRLFLGTSGEIGLAASCIREDDILCQFSDCDIAAVVRPNGERYHIISRAVIAKRNGEGKVRPDKLSPVTFKYNVPQSYAGSRLLFHVDGYVLQTLSCPLNLKPLSKPAVTEPSVSLGTSTL